MLPFRNILVLCEGNHCRSPLAEALLQSALGPDITVRSAGLRPLLGHPAEEGVRRLMAEHGTPIEAHRGRPLDDALALGSDLILVMDEAQKAEVLARIPATRGRVYLLGHWLPEASRIIPDPFRKGPEALQRSFDHIREAVQVWLPRLQR